MFSVSNVLMILGLYLAAAPAPPRTVPSQDMAERVDAAIGAAYKAASARMPCKIGTTSKSHMMHWQDVDKCLSGASNLVDWDALSKQLDGIRPPTIPAEDFASAVETSLTRHALPYDKVFRVKDAKALLPITNVVLKYLVPDTFANLPVFDHAGKKQLGSFAGTFIHDARGGLSTAKVYSLIMFQYKDPQGKIQTASDWNLLDSYGIPWSKVSTLAAYRLSSEKLTSTGNR
jgi:hypothetical protein